jgi:hypothetical protein
MPEFSYARFRASSRRAIFGVLILGLAIVGYFLWSSGSRQWQLRRVKAAWTTALDQENALLEGQIGDASKPVDEYFDDVAIPHIPDFLGDFKGFFSGTPRFVYNWAADKLAFHGYSDRVNNQVINRLATHFRFPEKFNASVRGSIERFQAIERQRDAELREKAYTLLQGAGINLDQAAVDSLLQKAHETAQKSAFEIIARDSAIDFGGAAAGKEVAVLAVQSLIVERVMLALAMRMGVVTTGVSGAGATAGAGTATGVGALPSWALAAAEIAVVVVVDLVLSRWLEGKAETQLREQLDEVRHDLKVQLGRYMKEYAQGLRQERAALMDVASGS